MRKLILNSGVMEDLRMLLLNRCGDCSVRIQVFIDDLSSSRPYINSVEGFTEIIQIFGISDDQLIV